jgi:hypothetical protein
MKQAIRLLFVMLIPMALSVAHACQVQRPSVEFARQASVVAIGRAVGERESGTKRLIQVDITEVLKGRADQNVEAVTPCALVRVGDAVVVVRIEALLFVLPADMYEASFREATSPVR